jgi:hypothetical protein
MKLRNLRIAWSVAWGIGAVILLILSASSYRTIYWCYGVPHNGQVIHLQVAGGLLILFVREEKSAWEAGSVPRKYAGEELIRPYTGFENLSSMSVRAFSGKELASLPVWLVPIVFLICATGSWLTPTFSLRTLLIATTLIAVGLGLVVWLR